MITLTFEAPPSTNQLYSGRRFKTERYKQWVRAAGWEIKLQRPQPIKGQFALTIYLPGRLDRDNIKAIPDLLKTMGIIEDDSARLMRRITVETTDGPCRVEIVPL